MTSEEREEIIGGIIAEILLKKDDDSEGFRAWLSDPNRKLSENIADAMFSALRNTQDKQNY